MTGYFINLREIEQPLR